MLSVVGVVRPVGVFSYGVVVERFLVVSVDGRPVSVLEGSVEYRLVGDSCVAVSGGRLEPCSVEELVAAARRVEEMAARERRFMRVFGAGGGLRVEPGDARPPRVLVPADDAAVAELVSTGFTRSYAIDYGGLTLGFNLDGCVEAAWAGQDAACIESDERVTRRRPRARLTVLGPLP